MLNDIFEQTYEAMKYICS